MMEFLEKIGFYQGWKRLADLHRKGRPVRKSDILDLLKKKTDLTDEGYWFMQELVHGNVRFCKTKPKDGFFKALCIAWDVFHEEQKAPPKQLRGGRTPREYAKETVARNWMISVREVESHLKICSTDYIKSLVDSDEYKNHEAESVSKNEW